MGEGHMNQNSNKSSFNIKTIIIIGVILTAAIVAAVVFISIYNDSSDNNNNASSRISTPKAGKWEGECIVKKQGKEDFHWILTFTVDKDGQTIASTQMYCYYGKLTSDTQASFVDSPNERTIDKNSFDFSFSVPRGYSSDTYKGKVTFTSATEAKGTLNIDGTDYEFTAAPK